MRFVSLQSISSTESVNEKIVKKKLDLARETQNTRKNLLSLFPPNPTPNTSTIIDSLQKTQTTLSASLARARYGLIRELVEVFDIKQDRLSTARERGGEWRIVGFTFPVPGDMRRQSFD